jgi:hypothetical protein
MIRRVVLAIVALALIALTSVGSSQPASAADTPPSVRAAGHFDADTATASYLATMTPAARARSDAYFEGGYWLLLWDLVIALLLAWILLASRLSARMRDFAVRLTRVRWAQTALYAIQYFILTTVVTLPWTAYEGYFREHQYGMSNLGLTGCSQNRRRGFSLP